MSTADFNYADSLSFVRRYRTTIARIARQHNECADDLIQDLHINYATWMKKYDPKRGKVSTRIFNKLAWHLRSSRRQEFRHVTTMLDENIIYVPAVDIGDQPHDLRDAPLPIGLPRIVRQTLEAARGCLSSKDLGDVLGMTDRGARKRIVRCERLATVREPVQLDFFTDLEGVF